MPVFSGYLRPTGFDDSEYEAGSGPCTYLSYNPSLAEQERFRFRTRN